MENKLTHLLVKHGVVRSFSIEKKVGKKELLTLKRKVTKQCKDKSEFDALFKDEIIRRTRSEIELGKIPGMMFGDFSMSELGESIDGLKKNKENSTPEKSDGGVLDNKKKNKPSGNYIPEGLADEKRMMLLALFSSTIAKKMLENGMKKEEICYTILSIATALGISEEDFKKFHDKYGPNKDIDPEDFDDEDEDRGF